MVDVSTTTAPGKLRGAALLRLIGIFKLLKGVVLIVAAISVFHLIHKNLAEEIIHWSARLRIAPGNVLVERLVERVLRVTKKQLIVLGTVLLVYSAMFTVEGIGLLRLRHWAEWMTVITTSGLIPLEIYEIVRRPSWLKVVATIVNVAIAVYLAVHVRNEMIERRGRRNQPH